MEVHLHGSRICSVPSNAADSHGYQPVKEEMYSQISFPSHRDDRTLHVVSLRQLRVKRARTSKEKDSINAALADRHCQRYCEWFGNAGYRPRGLLYSYLL